VKVTVLGIGNTLLTDEGFGPAVVAALAAKIDAEEAHRGEAEIVLVDGGVLGLKLLPFFLESDGVIVADAMDAGAEPGALFRFTPEEAGLEATAPLSAHEMALPHLVQTAALVGASPEVVVIACQAADISSLSETLTDGVAAAVPRAVELVLAEIDRMVRGSSPQPAEDEGVPGESAPNEGESAPGD
jgi:hydrogenase maturation protease